MSSPVKERFQLPPNIHETIRDAVLMNSGFTLALNHPNTALNRISVVGCYLGKSVPESILTIYRGEMEEDENKKRSVKHFVRGWKGVLLKESIRTLTIKPVSLVLKPIMEDYFEVKTSRIGKIKSDLTFASFVSAWEMVCNPPATLITMWQAQKKLRDIQKKLWLGQLYKGTLANGTKQFIIWYLFSWAERKSADLVGTYTPLDPRSIPGIVAKSIPQAFLVIPPVWIFYRTAFELQYRPELFLVQPQQNQNLRYLNVIKHIYKTQRSIGYVRGLSPALVKSILQATSVNSVLELGRRRKEKANINGVKV